MVKVVYLTVTGNTQILVNKLGVPSLELTEQTVDTILQDKFILIAPTFEKDVTYLFDEFLEFNKDKCVGIIGCGNLNFGQLFCFTAKDLSEKFNIPIIKLIEMFGSEQDIKYIKGVLDDIETTTRNYT